MAAARTSDGAGFKRSAHRLGQEVDTLKADLKADLNGLAHEAAATARSGAKQAVESAKNKLGEARDSASEAATSFKDVIARHPAATVGIATGVGILIGMILFRPRS